MRMLMVLAIVILGLATLTTTIRLIPPFVYYGLEAVAALVFLYIYTMKQRDFRRELRKSLEASGIIWGG